MHQPLTGDPLTDAVIPAATALVWAVRTGNRDDVNAALLDAQDCITQHTGPAGADLTAARALAIVLAALVPDDRSPADLLGWMANPEGYLELRGAGFDARTAAAFAAEHARTAVA